MSEVREDQLGDETPPKNPEQARKGEGAGDNGASGNGTSNNGASGNDGEGIEKILADAASAAGDATKIEAELAELKDKNLRLYAEFDNYRRRTAKESFELMATANAGLVGKLIEVLDNFNRAFDPQNKASAEDFEKGVKLIYGRFKAILDAEGLEEIDPKGGEFDPNLHEALLQQPSDTVPENHVIQTIQKGYKLKAKILTHAKVIVSKGKED